MTAAPNHWETAGICPVCRRLIAISNVRHVAAAHADKAGRACPMSGREMS